MYKIKLLCYTSCSQITKNKSTQQIAAIAGAIDARIVAVYIKTCNCTTMFNSNQSMRRLPVQNQQQHRRI